MRTRPLFRRGVSLLAVSLLCLPACGTKDDGTGPDDSIPETNIEFDMLAGALWGEISGVAGAMMLPGGPPGCLTITADSDADGDGVPGQATFTYSASGCQYSFDGGSGTTSGSITVRDPGEPFGFTATLNGVAYAQSMDASSDEPASTRIRTLTGERTVGGSPSQVTLTQDVDLTYTTTGKPSATAKETWQAVLTPIGGASVILGYGVRVPDGGVVLTGPMTWVQSGSTIHFSLETPVPLRFPPTCESPFPSSGEVHVRVVSGGPAGYVRLAWSSCGGEAEIDFIEG